MVFEDIDRVLLLGFALLAGALALVAPWEVALGALLLLAMAGAFRGRRRRAAVTVAFGIAVGAFRANAAISRHEVERSTADAVLGLPQRCSAHARVEGSPVRTRDVLRWEAALDTVICDGHAVAWTGDATLYGGPTELARGDEVEVVATLGAPQRLWNAAGGDPRPAEALRHVVRSGGSLDVRFVKRASGLYALIDRARARLRTRIDATFSVDLAPMARALVLGENDLAPDDDRSFRASGLSHLLAVSGMHLVLVLALATRTLQGLLSRIEAVAAAVDVGRIASGAGIPVAWLYAELAGGGGSTVRAAWMATVVLAARLLGRRTDPTRAFGLSMSAMALANPLVAFDLSFVLSVGATGGLLAFARPLGARLSAAVPGRAAGIARAAATTVAASLPCLPIIARFAPTVPVGGVLANLLAVPVGECVALPLCLGHALLAWWPAAERGCAAVASGALVLVRAVARG
jgi:competence protein ComEC